MCRKLLPGLENLALVTSLKHARWRETLPWPILQAGTIHAAPDKCYKIWREIVSETLKNVAVDVWRWKEMAVPFQEALSKAEEQSREEVTQNVCRGSNFKPCS